MVAWRKRLCRLRTVKTALNLLFVMRKYTKILHWFTEIEWLPSVGFLALSSLFSPLVSCFSADCEVDMSEFQKGKFSANYNRKLAGWWPGEKNLHRNASS